MPEIIIEQSTFERLQSHAKPLVDTTDMVLNRALDALELREHRPDPEDDSFVMERRIDPRYPPDLTHTKILAASLAGQRIDNPNWNLLLRSVLIRAMKQWESFDKLRQICPANMVRGCKNDEGYRYLDEVDFSVQGMSTNDACAALVPVARSLGIGLEIVFMWRPKRGAAYPGEKAQLRMPGKPDAG
jgi:hypothetical protein